MSSDGSEPSYILHESPVYNSPWVKDAPKGTWDPEMLTPYDLVESVKHNTLWNIFMKHRWCFKQFGSHPCMGMRKRLLDGRWGLLAVGKATWLIRQAWRLRVEDIR